MQVMAETETVTIDGEEYYPLQKAAKIIKPPMTGWGLNQRLIRMGKKTKKLPGSNRVYVRKEDIDFLLGKESE